MFSGLVADLGRVESIVTGDDGARISLETTLAGEIATGDSVAVNGVCLTAVSLADGSFSADVMAETLRRSSLGSLAPGDPGGEQLPPPGREPCVRMLGHGVAPFAASLDNSQHAGGLPICHYSDVNNLLALNN